MKPITVLSYLEDEQACFALVSARNGYPYCGELVICFKDTDERKLFFTALRPFEEEIGTTSISRDTAIKFLMMAEQKTGINCYISDDDIRQNMVRERIASNLSLDLIKHYGFGIVANPLAIDPLQIVEAPN